MEQVILHPATATGYHFESTTKPGLFTNFMRWCAAQEEYRFLWLGITFLGQIGLVLPATLVAILFFGNNHLYFWIAAVTINVPVLALTLAAQPTKITLPCLFGAWLLDICLMITCIGVYMAA